MSDDNILALFEKFIHKSAEDMSSNGQADNTSSVGAGHTNPAIQQMAAPAVGQVATRVAPTPPVAAPPVTGMGKGAPTSNAPLKQMNFNSMA